MQRWESVEAILPKYRNQKEKRKLANHLKKLALIVLLSALGKKFRLKIDPNEIKV